MSLANRNRFGRGNLNPRWRGGVHLHRGYPRVSSGRHRHKFVHRLIIELILVEEPLGLVWQGLQSIPTGFHVHHIDNCKTHFCLGNLMVLSEPIHNAISVSHQKFLKKFYQMEENLI